MRRFLAPPALLGGMLFALAAAAAADPAPDEKGKRVEVPYRLTDTKHVLVRAKINGKGPFNLILDTGAPAVFITKSVAKKAGVKHDDKAEKGLVEFDRFEVEGGLVVPHAKARVEDLFQLQGMNSMGFAGVELHGVIGYNVLARYRIEYDFTADKLGFEEIPGFEPPGFVRIKGGKSAGSLEMMGPLMKMMAALMGIKPNFDIAPRGFVGLEFAEKDGIVVTKVLSGSPAEKAGVRVGDRIEQVRNTEIETARGLHRALAKAGVGTRLRVTVRRGGEEKELTLELGRGL